MTSILNIDKHWFAALKQKLKTSWSKCYELEGLGWRIRRGPSAAGDSLNFVEEWEWCLDFSECQAHHIDIFLTKVTKRLLGIHCEGSEACTSFHCHWGWMPRQLSKAPPFPPYILLQHAHTKLKLKLDSVHQPEYTTVPVSWNRIIRPSHTLDIYYSADRPTKLAQKVDRWPLYCCLAFPHLHHLQVGAGNCILYSLWLLEIPRDPTSERWRPFWPPRSAASAAVQRRRWLQPESCNGHRRVWPCLLLSRAGAASWHLLSVAG